MDYPPRSPLLWRRLLSLNTPSLLLLTTIALLLCPDSGSAYIPAVAVNDTSSLNATDSSNMNLRWVAGVFTASVTYQLRADVDTGGTDVGALVHFTESGAGDNISTSTPWIAMISCDYNETGASDTWDIFTLARDRGAVAALLYTTTSESCLINQDYISNFEKPVDVFATATSNNADLIQNQFNNTNSTFYYYNNTLLNQSVDIVNASIDGATITTRTFLIATLTARNSTGQMEPAPTSTTTAVVTTPKNKSTSTPLIVLYSITGLVTVLFAGVVLTGAIRAIRHPERYGPNADPDGDAQPQTTAAGVGQAILDTFPVIKFNKATKSKMAYPTYDKAPDDPRGYSTLDHTRSEASLRPPMASPDSKGDLSEDSIEMVDRRRSVTDSEGSSFQSAGEVMTSARSSFHGTRTPPLASGSTEPEIAAASRALAARRSSLQGMDDWDEEAEQAAMIRGATSRRIAEVEDAEAESCPICLLEFETGDDVRVLPCQLAHSFHKACIDPWLLQVSSSCPLCRKDFNEQHEGNAESPATVRARGRAGSDDVQSDISEGADGFAEAVGEDGGARQAGSRFARYLTFVRRERRRGEVQNRVPQSVSRRRERRSNEQTGPGPF